jgi:hypothetical protein
MCVWFPETRVARWCISKPKIPIWVNIGGPCNGRCWFILRPFGKFYGHLVYMLVIWYICCLFGIFVGSKKNLATLPETEDVPFPAECCYQGKLDHLAKVSFLIESRSSFFYMQSDQMSFLKKTQKCSPAHFCHN